MEKDNCDSKYSDSSCNAVTDTDSCYERKHKRKHKRRNSTCETDTDSCYTSERYSYEDCSNECGPVRSKTPIGVWNLRCNCENGATTTGELTWLSQLILNGDCTATNYMAPDITNTPFPCALTPLVGIWKECRGRKIKLKLTTIGTNCGDGSPMLYYRFNITMRTNRRGVCADLCGEATAFAINDPEMCSHLDMDPISFTGSAVKVLEPSD